MYNKRFLIHDPESLNLILEVYEVQIRMDYRYQSLLQHEKGKRAFFLLHMKNI